MRLPARHILPVDLYCSQLCPRHDSPFNQRIFLGLIFKTWVPHHNSSRCAPLDILTAETKFCVKISTYHPCFMNTPRMMYWLGLIDSEFHITFMTTLETQEIWQSLRWWTPESLWCFCCDLIFRLITKLPINLDFPTTCLSTSAHEIDRIVCGVLPKVWEWYWFIRTLLNWCALSRLLTYLAKWWFRKIIIKELTYSLWSFAVHLHRFWYGLNNTNPFCIRTMAKELGPNLTKQKKPNAHVSFVKLRGMSCKRKWGKFSQHHKQKKGKFTLANGLTSKNKPNLSR